MIGAPSSAVHLEKDDKYLGEIWASDPESPAEYAIGVLVILLRFAVRIRTIGLKGFQGDDYLAILALLLFTVDALMCHFSYFTGGNIDVTPDQVDSLSDKDIAILTLGSKMEWVTWYSYPSFIWTLKFSILFFYRRLTSNGLATNRVLLTLFWFCGLTYAILIITISSTCRPYSANWQIRPLPGFQCIFRAQNFIALAILNIVTDVAILTVPVPMLWQLRVSWWRKIIVSLLLCGGLFVITAAIVRAVLTLGSQPSVITVNLWGFRETVVALVAVSAPVLSPLIRPAFWRWERYLGPVERARVEHRELPRSGRWGGMRGLGRGTFPSWFKSMTASSGSKGTRGSSAPKTTVVAPETTRLDPVESRSGDVEAGCADAAGTICEVRGLNFVTGSEFLVEEEKGLQETTSSKV